jgi:hypothetical protein
MQSAVNIHVLNETLQNLQAKQELFLYIFNLHSTHNNDMYIHSKYIVLKTVYYPKL